MASPSPPPNSAPSEAVSPAPATVPPPPTTITLPPPPSSTSPSPPSPPLSTPHPSSSPPPPSSTTPSPLSQPSASPPDPPSSSVQSRPPQSPLPATPSVPPPATPLTPPPQPHVTSAPPPKPPPSLPPPPGAAPPRPGSTRSPLPPLPPPTPPLDPPATSSPPPLAPRSSNPPQSSPPPSPLRSSPPPSSDQTVGSPPPPPRPSSQPPRSSPPSPALEPPGKSPPPAPGLVPPQRSLPPPASDPPTHSPLSPDTNDPSDAPPPQRHTSSQPASQPTPPPSNSSSSTPSSSSPTPLIRSAPPPPQVPGSNSDNPGVNKSSPNAPESSGSSEDNGIGTGILVAIGAAVGIVILSFIVLVVWCLRRRKKHFSGISDGHVMSSSMGCSPTSESAFWKTQSSAPLVGNSSSSEVYTPSEPGGLGHSKALFTYEELVKATNEFSSQNLLGEGGFGSVYKGLLPDGREVAVKQLKLGGGQGDREFKAEVETISRIHHRYLVSLVGYCISENLRLLIYDYVPNNNLYFHLHEGRPVLDWIKRVKIAAGAARGIAYLHEDCHPRIIHRDIKSSNILVDNSFEARVSDFGLAKLALDANTHVTTRVIGTFGYVAPEYASSGKLTEKSDVFSFGVVLLELITGRKPVDASQPLGDESLVEWARPLLSHALETEEFEALADPRLGGNYVDAEMFRMIGVAAACVRHSAAKRPRMGQVVRAFDSMAGEDLTNGMKLGESEIFNSAQQSEEIRLFRRMAFGSQNYSTDFYTHSSWNSREENV